MSWLVFQISKVQGLFILSYQRALIARKTQEAFKHAKTIKKPSKLCKDINWLEVRSFKVYHQVQTSKTLHYAPLSYEISS